MKADPFAQLKLLDVQELDSRLDLLRHQVFVHEDWPGGVFASPGILGTRPGGAYAGSWARDGGVAGDPTQRGLGRPPRGAAAIVGWGPQDPNNERASYRDRSVRLNSTTGTSPTSTSASEGSAASARRSSRASW